MMRMVLLPFLVPLIGACEPAPLPVSGEPGTPLPGLSEEELGHFYAGRAIFNRIFTPEEGLGPAFNENQCSACHTVPAVGGTTGFERIVKATRHGGPGVCDLLTHEGGENIRSRMTPLLAGHRGAPESIPSSATEVARFLPPFLFGLGLVEAIPEETILALADPDDRDGNGVSGRAARGPDGRLTRFGRKADVVGLEEFTRSALLFEMGLTTRPDEHDRVGGGPAPSGTDPAPEPEINEQVVDLLTAFTRFLAPPAPAPPVSGAHADTLAAGARLFERVGCAECHTPTLRTGPSEIAALSGKTVQLYSDLLLHDMGPDLSNVCAYDAGPAELRTALLTGLAHRQFFMHDGRAQDLRDAILMHGGEAQAARDGFARLPGLHQEYLLMFLRSL